jgi:uncharacterized protein with NAD-binding domain and iron-sulfur cluster
MEQLKKSWVLAMRKAHLEFLDEKLGLETLEDQGQFDQMLKKLWKSNHFQKSLTPAQRLRFQALDLRISDAQKREQLLSKVQDLIEQLED